MTKKIISLILILATMFTIGTVSFTADGVRLQITSKQPNKSITSYQQSDSRWGNHPYGYCHDYNGNLVNATISSSGCGLLSLVNVVYYINGSFINPTFLADYSVSHGYRITDNGTAHALYAAFCKDHGSDYAIVYGGEAYDYDSLIGHLSNGEGAIVSGSPNHLIAVVDYDKSTKKFLILDSAMANKRCTTPNGYVWMTKEEIANNNYIDFKKFMFIKNTHKNCPGAIFTDMPPIAHWAHEAIDWAVKYNISYGTSANTFSPDKKCTRAEIITLLWRYYGEPKPKNKNNPFYDVKTGDYYYNAVLWAKEKNITSGTSAHYFSPNNDCTRAQIVTFLWNAAGYPNPKSRYNPFYDVSSNAYYYNAVLWAVQNNITSGTSENYFSPNSNCTRAQAVTFIYRYNKISGLRPYNTQKIQYQEDVFLSEKSMSLNIGEKSKLSANVELPDVSDKSVTWYSSNPNVVTVDENGNLKAIKEGTVTIVAYANAKSSAVAYCNIIVGKDSVVKKNDTEIATKITEVQMKEIVENAEIEKETKKAETEVQSKTEIVSSKCDTEGNNTPLAPSRYLKIRAKIGVSKYIK